jgi:hypothetical protein
MNRIVAKFAQLKSAGKKGLVVYIGAGDPDLAATHDLAVAFAQAGVDVLELGVPFSDPLADGLVNQLAAQRGLESGTTPPKLLATIAAIRRDSQVPIVLYIYFNLIHRLGLEAFIAGAAQAGVDGLLVLDLPPEESDNYEALTKKHGLCNIYLVAPTTPEERMKYIVQRGTGFIYYIERPFRHHHGRRTRRAFLAVEPREDAQAVAGILGKNPFCRKPSNGCCRSCRQKHFHHHQRAPRRRKCASSCRNCRRTTWWPSRWAATPAPP